MKIFFFHYVFPKRSVIYTKLLQNEDKTKRTVIFCKWEQLFFLQSKFIPLFKMLASVDRVLNVLFLEFESESYISSMDKPPFVTSLPRNMRRFISVTFSSSRAEEYF